MPKMKFEVSVLYQGISYYIVEAYTADEAEEVARVRYEKCDPEDGDGWEDVSDISARLMEP